MENIKVKTFYIDQIERALVNSTINEFLSDKNFHSATSCENCLHIFYSDTKKSAVERDSQNLELDK